MYRFVLVVILFMNSMQQLQSMHLPSDLWVKIIACCNTSSKNSLGKSSIFLYALHLRSNLDLYLQDPFVLTEKQGEYALIYCAYKNNLATIKNLLCHGVSTTYTYCGLATEPLAIAQYYKNQEMVDLLQQYFQPSGDGTKILPYALAAFLGDYETLQKRIATKRYNALYESSGIWYEKSTILKLAIFRGHRAVVELLLTHPETIKYINFGKKGDKPIDIAFRKGHSVIVELLLAVPSLERNSLRRFFYDCVKNGYTDCLLILLKREKMPVNKGHMTYIGDPYGNSELGFFDCFSGYIPPLTKAAANGHSDTVALLLKTKKIRVNIPAIRRYEKKYENLTPLYVASLKGHTKIVEQLLSHETIQPCLYFDYYTPLHIACKRGYLDIVKLLIHHSPQLLSMKTKNTDESPYQVAYHYKQHDVVKFLLELNNK